MRFDPREIGKNIKQGSLDIQPEVVYGELLADSNADALQVYASVVGNEEPMSDKDKRIVAYSTLAALAGKTSVETLNDAIGSMNGASAIDRIRTEMLSFDGATDGHNVAKTLEYNARASRQDAYAEAFFRTVVYPTGVLTVTNKIPTVYKANVIEHDGKGNTHKLESIVKAMTSVKGSAGINQLKIIPIAGTSVTTDAYLVVEAKKAAIDPATGTDVETAPIKIGKKVPLFDIVQSTASVAKGYLNSRDTLAPEAELKSLEFTTGGDTPSIIEIPISGLGARFEGTTNGSDYGLQLVKEGKVAVPLSELTVYKNGTAAGLTTDNITAVYDVSLTGTGNALDKTINVSVINWELSKILDANGNVIPTTDTNYSTYADVANKISKDTIVGYELDAELVNSNLRRRGNRLIVAAETDNGFIAPKTPYNIENTIGDSKGSDIEAIKQIGALVAREVSALAFLTIEKVYKELKTLDAYEVDADGRVTKSAISKTIKATLKEDTVNLSELNSIEQHSRQDDIAARLLDKFKVIANQLFTESGLSVLLAGEEAEVVIGVGSNIGSFLPSTFEISKGFNARVVTSTFAEAQGIANITINPVNSEPNKEDYRGFGTFRFSPSVVYDLKVVTSNEAYSEHLIVPQYEHVPHNYVLGRVEITGLESAVEAVATIMRTA